MLLKNHNTLDVENIDEIVGQDFLEIREEDVDKALELLRTTNEYYEFSDLECSEEINMKNDTQLSELIDEPGVSTQDTEKETEEKINELEVNNFFNNSSIDQNKLLETEKINNDSDLSFIIGFSTDVDNYLLETTRYEILNELSNGSSTVEQQVPDKLTVLETNSDKISSLMQENEVVKNVSENEENTFLDDTSNYSSKSSDLEETISINEAEDLILPREMSLICTNDFEVTKKIPEPSNQVITVKIICDASSNHERDDDANSEHLTNYRIEQENIEVSHLSLEDNLLCTKESSVQNDENEESYIPANVLELAIEKVRASYSIQSDSNIVKLNHDFNNNNSEIIVNQDSLHIEVIQDAIRKTVSLTEDSQYIIENYSIPVKVLKKSDQSNTVEAYFIPVEIIKKNSQNSSALCEESDISKPASPLTFENDSNNIDNGIEDTQSENILKDKESIETNNVLVLKPVDISDVVSQTEPSIVENQSRPKFTCDICQASILSKEALKKHMRFKHMTKFIKCKICSKHLSPSSLYMHNRIQHAPKLYVECTICNAKLKHERILMKHLKQIHKIDNSKKGPQPFERVCVKCGRVFTNKNTFYDHVRIKHARDPKKFRVTCEICQATFNKRYTLLQHIARIHNETKSHCPICQKVILDKNALKLHIEKHDKGPSYVCIMCNKIYTNRFSLDHHNKTIHPKNPAHAKPAQCNICCSWLSNEHSLKVHLRRKHKMSNIKTAKRIDDNAFEKLPILVRYQESFEI